MSMVCLLLATKVLWLVMDFNLFQMLQSALSEEWAVRLALRCPLDKSSCSHLIMEALLKGKAQYSSPPCTTLLKSSALNIANIIYSFTKQVTLTRRSTVFSPPFQLVFHDSIMIAVNYLDR
jgi:hypothetical protein